MPRLLTICCLLLAVLVAGCAEVQVTRLQRVPTEDLPTFGVLQPPPAPAVPLPHRYAVTWVDEAGVLRPPSRLELQALTHEMAGPTELVALASDELPPGTSFVNGRVAVVAFLWNEELEGVILLYEERGPVEEFTGTLTGSVRFLTPEVEPLLPRYQPVTPSLWSSFTGYHSLSAQVIEDGRSRERDDLGYAGLFLGGAIGGLIGGGVVALMDDPGTLETILIPTAATAAGALLSLPIAYYYDYIFLLPGAAIADFFQIVGFSLFDAGHTTGRILIDGVAYPGLALADAGQYVGAGLWDGLRLLGALLVDGLIFPYHLAADPFQEVETRLGVVLATPRDLQLEQAIGLEATAVASDRGVATEELFGRARLLALEELGAALNAGLEATAADTP